jgi:hypothetical protein
MGVVYRARPVEIARQTRVSNDGSNRALPHARYLPKDQGADMWRRQKALQRLREELTTIELFDRLHSYATNPDPADNAAYAQRQLRRSQVMAEIRALDSRTYRKEAQDRVRLGTGAALLLFAVAYAVHHLLR